MVDTAAVCSGGLWSADDILGAEVKLEGALVFFFFLEGFPHSQETPSALLGLCLNILVFMLPNQRWISLLV